MVAQQRAKSIPDVERNSKSVQEEKRRTVSMYFIVEHKEDYTEAGMRRTLPGRIGTQPGKFREEAALRTKVRRILPPSVGFLV